MAQRGRPRKIVDETGIQEVEGEFPHDSDEPSAFASLEVEESAVFEGGKGTGEIASVFVDGERVTSVSEEKFSLDGGVVPTPVSLNGWLPIESASRNGVIIRLSDKPEGEGTLAAWKKTRAFANATHRWEATGFFVDSVSNQKITFEPKYWKPRV